MGVDLHVSTPELAWTSAGPGAAARVVQQWRRLSLATRFLIANLIALVVAAVVLGVWVGRQIESGVLARTATVTALYADSVVAPQLQHVRADGALDDQTIATLDRLLSRTDLGEQIVSLKIWSIDGTLLYNPIRELVGRRFPVEGGLARAVSGEVAAEMSDLSEAENTYERQHWPRLVEVYVPVRADRGGDLLAVMEVYQLPDELEAQIRESQLLSWGVVALTMTVTYLLFAGIVRSGSDTIARQANALRARVEELQRVLADNRRLQGRVAQAARRSTTLNERARRRIGADLHDGPAQALALALLRLEDGPGHGPLSESDLLTVRSALSDALVDLRAIAADLRMPALTPLTIQEVAERAVHDHERHANARVALETKDLDREAPLAIKIALLRTIQEALSNASRHGLGRDMRARVWVEGSTLHLEVSDRGPGFVVGDRADRDHLGIEGMRERTELLGGTFTIHSVEGTGTTVRAAWPVSDMEEE